MRYFLMVFFLSLPLTAQAAWSEPGMNSLATPQVRIEPQHRIDRPVQPPQPARHYVPPPTPKPANPVFQNQPGRPRQTRDHHDFQAPDYFRRDVAYYYQQVQVPYPYADVDSGFVVPDGFETIFVNGETFYYNQGSFYQQVGDQLTAIPAVIGAVVDYIPTDYQIVMADGMHYLFTQGVYYQRVDQGFEVVQAPVLDQE